MPKYFKALTLAVLSALAIEIALLGWLSVAAS
jgi:hypothetical protein